MGSSPRDARPPLIAVDDLEVRFPGPEGDVVALDAVSLALYPGEVFGLVGETGAGKSLTAWAALGLVPAPGRMTRGEVTFGGEALSGASPERLRALRGDQISVIVQNPRGALNPMLSIGQQLRNVIRAHRRVTRAEADELVLEALRSVGIPSAERRMGDYPHQLSGGQAQRAVIAMALINEPALVIADEPTTGLDVTLQAEILDLMVNLVRRAGSTVWIITHDLGIIANYTDRAAVMFAGEVIEVAPTPALFEEPRHPYTQNLLASSALDRAARRAVTHRNQSEPPDLVHRRLECQFGYRCPWVEEGCMVVRPELTWQGHERAVRCLVAQREYEAREAARPR